MGCQIGQKEREIELVTEEKFFSPFHLFSKWGGTDFIYPKLDQEQGEEVKRSFYHSWKPYLFRAGFYDYILGKESYWDFQKKLSILAEEPLGVSLALSCMVEVNVAGGILLASPYSKPGSHFLWESFSGIEPFPIVSVGVSEPGFDGKLKKLSSKLENGRLTGVKSFITNGGEADFVFWVTKSEDKNPVYLVRLKPKTLQNGKIQLDPDSSVSLQKEIFFTPFTPHVSHLRLVLGEYPISPEDLILEDYGQLGMELRLKELLSLVSLLIGKTKKVSMENPKIAFERNKLIEWWKTYLSHLKGNPTKDALLEGFPFPIQALVLALTEHWNLKAPEELKSIDPDYQLFVWEDSFTKYLIQKKKHKPT